MSDFVDSIADAFLTEEPSSEVVEHPATRPETRQEAPSLDPQPELQAPEPEQPPQGGQIPIQALLDEREKRQEARREADALRAQMAQIQAAQQASQTPRPDLYDDPDAFAADLQRQQAEALFRTTAQVSARFAAKEHGEDTLKSAVDWAGGKNDQYLHQRFMASDDPYGLLVTEFKRDQLLSKLGNDPDAYVRQRFAELSAGSQTAQPVPQGATQQQPAPKPVVRSLASQPNAGSGPTPLDTGFDSLTFNLDRKR